MKLGITYQRAWEIASEPERDVLSILVRGSVIKTNRQMLQAAQEICRLFTKIEKEKTSQPSTEPING